MSTEKDDQWLDELISRTINTGKPQFDAEKWKKEYPDEFQTLLSRAAREASSHRPGAWAIVFSRPISKFAVAAVLVFGLAIGILMGWDTWQKPDMQTLQKSQMAQLEPTALYNLDYLSDAPKGSLTDAYLTLLSATNGRER